MNCLSIRRNQRFGFGGIFAETRCASNSLIGDEIAIKLCGQVKGHPDRFAIEKRPKP
jgi:hypothetical protein